MSVQKEFILTNGTDYIYFNSKDNEGEEPVKNAIKQ